MHLDQMFNSTPKSKIVEDDTVIDTNNRSISIKLFSSEYEEFIKEEYNELKKYNEEKNKPWTKEEELATENELIDIIIQTRRNLIDFYKKVNGLTDKLLEKWSDSSIIIKPLFSDEKEFLFTPVNDFNVIVKNGQDGADFTVFDGGELVDDILDFGDSDFFQNTNLESDYFLLVNYVINPNYVENSRMVIVYTARPKQDRDIYTNTKKIPVGIFLTTNINDVEGIAQDMSDRDIYKIKIDSKYLTKTLERNTLIHFQSFNPNSRTVPVENIEKLT